MKKDKRRLAKVFFIYLWISLLILLSVSGFVLMIYTENKFIGAILLIIGLILHYLTKRFWWEEIFMHQPMGPGSTGPGN